MPIRNPADLIQALASGQRLMGLDVGEKTIGLALSDTTRTIATPLETLRRTKFTADALKLADLVTANKVGGLVLGFPINMDGTEGPRAQSTRSFADNLSGKIDIGIAFWDERMSTQAVTRTMLDADLSRARRAEIVDKLAAAYILQGFLDRFR